MCRIGFVQYEVRFGAAAENAATVRRLLTGVQADLLVLPELSLSGYDFPNPQTVREAAEPFGEGPTFSLASELAVSTGAVIVAGYPERGSAGCYNSALLATPAGGLYNYRKIHLFNREQDIFLPGDAPPPVIETAMGRVGVMICFDWFFPEVARSLALRGADVLAHPSNLVLPWCQRAMFARCVENAVFSITANRTGTEAQAGRSLTFTGGSQVMTPDGEVLASASTTAEAVAVVPVDLPRARDKTRADRNDLFKNRRLDMYTGL